MMAINVSMDEGALQEKSFRFPLYTSEDPGYGAQRTAITL
jgi:hypothetical protein